MRVLVCDPCVKVINAGGGVCKQRVIGSGAQDWKKADGYFYWISDSCVHHNLCVIEPEVF